MALSEQAFQQAASELGCEVAAVKAVCAVESAGGGFNPDGSVKTLFEGHIFYRFTNGRFATSNPDLCYKSWTKQFYGKSWKAEQERLSRAVALNREAALKSASWGLFQIMGMNHSYCGCKTVQEFVNKMFKSEDSQLSLFVEFIINKGLADELRDKRWADFARVYNGPGQKDYYAGKLQAAYERNK